MEVVLNTQNLINDIGARYLMELNTSDPIPPRGSLLQSLNEADARLSAIIGRYLEPSFRNGAKDDLRSAESYRYRFLLSPRKAVGKAQPLADLIHSYMVNSALTKCYTSMGQKDLAEKHDAQTVSDAQAINQLLHSKQPPM